MADFSFPWTSSSSDRQIPSSQQRALYARLLSNGVLKAFTGTVSDSTLSMTAGSAIVNGAFYDVGTGVDVALPGSGSSATIVVRYDETARSCSLVAITTAPVNAGGVLDLPIATLTKSASVWSAPVFSWAQSVAIGVAPILDLLDNGLTSANLADGSVFGPTIPTHGVLVDKLDSFVNSGAFGNLGGYGLDWSRITRRGPIVQFMVAIRTISTFSTDARGFIDRLNSGIKPAYLAEWSGCRPSVDVPIRISSPRDTVNYANSSLGGGWMTTDGVIHLTNLQPSTEYPTNTSFIVNGMYVLD